jgi:hypothetical protein
MTVIVPDSLRDAINAKLDEAYAVTPEAAADREAHYHALLDYFNDNGKLPDFSLQKAAP